jgi:hypothetical protein
LKRRPGRAGYFTAVKITRSVNLLPGKNPCLNPVPAVGDYWWKPIKNMLAAAPAHWNTSSVILKRKLPEYIYQDRYS